MALEAAQSKLEVVDVQVVRASSALRDLALSIPTTTTTTILLLPPTLPPKTKPLPPTTTPLPLQPRLLLPLPLLRLAPPEILPVRRHPIAHLPLPLVEADHLRDLHLPQQSRPSRGAGRAEGLDFPALVGVREERAGRAVGAVGRDAGVRAGYEGGGGEVAVAAGRVDEEAVAAHGIFLWRGQEFEDVYTR